MPDSPIRKMEINGIVTENMHAIVNSFNSFFQSVFTQACPVQAPLVQRVSAMPEIEITERGILNLLLQLDPIGPQISSERSKDIQQRIF